MRDCLRVRSRLSWSGMLFVFAIGFFGCHNDSTGDGAVVSDVDPLIGVAGDVPAVTTHVSQREIEAEVFDVDELIAHGQMVFEANFNTLDGAGRPESTGTGGPRARREFPENMNRISGPDANSCAGCHNLPRSGGGGDNVANVFVLAQALPFVNFDGGAGDNFEDQTLKGVGNERGTLSMFGSGYVEMLAREMSTDLQAIRDEAIEEAVAAGEDVTRDLLTKGVDFGSITAHADGTVSTDGVDGVDADLVIKPFHQKGAVISIRQFTNNAMNHHHGIQPEERFGLDEDPDNDGVRNELTVGDITCATLFQILLPVPGEVLPLDKDTLEATQRGAETFDSLGCADCHIPALRLENPVYTEPNPFNPPGNLQVDEVTKVLSFDLTEVAAEPRLNKEADGSVMVPLFTDLKRHDMGELLNNEQKVQDGIPTEEWLTRKLWGFASEPPFLHHGRATTIREAILAHGGDAQTPRDDFADLDEEEQRDVIEFLKTLQILPEGAKSRVTFASTSGEIGDEKAIPLHLDQQDIDDGLLDLSALVEHGERVFAAAATTEDGAGRPESTGTGGPRDRIDFPDNNNRISGGDANSCAGCHNMPRTGGGGDNVANVFVLAQALPFVNFDEGAGDNFTDHTLTEVGNERGTLGMFGSGYIELLAREMTTELHEIRDAAIAESEDSGDPVEVSLDTKGVHFGSLTAFPDGSLDTNDVEGVDTDLIIKPFHQKGAVISLRQFTNNAFNHHHGLQSAERFGEDDVDGDGIDNELTDGDITAVTLFQAQMAVPGRVMPSDPDQVQLISEGEELFRDVGCASCHIPELRLDNPVFTEPNPFNPEGNLSVDDVKEPFELDLTAEAAHPRLPRAKDGSVMVPAFTDLKRHDMGEELNNEFKVQDGIPTEEWLTRKLWGFYSEPPFLHHGRAQLIGEAIEKHGGEALEAREQFEALSERDQTAVIAFLKTLRILPEGETRLVITEEE